MIQVYRYESTEELKYSFIGSVQAVSYGYATLPQEPELGILAGILADYIEEYAYAGVEPSYGCERAECDGLFLDSLEKLLVALRLEPLSMCVVSIDFYYTGDAVK